MPVIEPGRYPCRPNGKTLASARLLAPVDALRGKTVTGEEFRMPV
jgi:hypothetical protein